jgi:hypothetical protein
MVPEQDRRATLGEVMMAGRGRAARPAITKSYAKPRNDNRYVWIGGILGTYWNRKPVLSWMQPSRVRHSPAQPSG